MRKIIYMLMLVLPLSSCAGWLSVESTDRIMEDKLYEDRDGFYTALNGVYVDLVKTSLYSGTFGPSVPDILAQYYDTSADSHVNGSLAQYQAEAKRLAVSDSWTRAYFLILNMSFFNTVTIFTLQIIQIPKSTKRSYISIFYHIARYKTC